MHLKNKTIHWKEIQIYLEEMYSVPRPKARKKRLYLYKGLVMTTLY